MPLFPSPCSSWFVGSYDTLPALMSSLEQSLATTFGLPFADITFNAHFSFHTPLCPLTHHVCAPVGHTPCMCAYIIFPLKSSHDARRFPGRYVCSNHICHKCSLRICQSGLLFYGLFSLYLSLFLSHTHTHTLSTFLSLSGGCFWVPGALYSDLSPLLAYTGFW